MATQPGEIIVARCGLVCSHCGAHRRGKCRGCHSDRPMFANCPVKACATFHECTTCADCTRYSDLRLCTKLNNFISKIFGFLFRTDRIGNLEQIRQIGLEAFKTQRAASGRK